MIPKTKLIYQGDTYLFKLTAKVLAFRAAESKAVIILDQTIFYPQGGGQPSDVGTIKSTTSKAVMSVSMVKNVEGIVEHEGIVSGGVFGEGEEVDLEINQSLRLLHSRIHSAGHLLDHAMQHLNLPIVGSKGYHFPAGPYVEYRLTSPDFDVSPAGLAALRGQWEAAARQIVKEDRSIATINADPKQLDPALLESLPEKARSADVVRLIQFKGFPLPGPCGGTHVARTSEIGEFSIKKISYKSDALRVGYTIG